VGNPCPLLLIRLPDSIVTFHEGKAALAEVEARDSSESLFLNDSETAAIGPKHASAFDRSRPMTAGGTSPTLMSAFEN